MAVDFTTQLYLPNFDMWARPVTFFPLASQPGAPAYDARGIYDSNDFDFDLQYDQVISDARIELDILMMEFTVLPLQGDQVRILPWMQVSGGFYEITDVTPDNAGGEMTCILRRIVDTKIPAYVMQASAWSLGGLDFATPTMTVT